LPGDGHSLVIQVLSLVTLTCFARHGQERTFERVGCRDGVNTFGEMESRAMTRHVLAVGVAVLVVVVAAGCGRATEEPMMDAQAAMEMPPETAEGVDIAFRSEPAPPQMGQNTFEVTVRDERGEPVTDAEVEVEFYMPAMPQMNMPEMRDRATLQHESGGTYRGTGQVVMGGDWAVTVTATRGGEEIGRRTLHVTAQQ
jgi:hypothetical protein